MSYTVHDECTFTMQKKTVCMSFDATFVCICRTPRQDTYTSVQMTNAEIKNKLHVDIWFRPQAYNLCPQSTHAYCVSAHRDNHIHTMALAFVTT